MAFLRSVIVLLVVSFLPRQSGTSGLVAYWPLDAVTGGTATPDASTTSPSNTATLNGSPAPAPAVLGNGFAFTRSASQFLSVADAPSLQFGTGSFSVSLWARPSNLTNKLRVINKWDDAGTGWLLDFNSEAGGGDLPGTIRFRLTDAANASVNTALVTATGVLTSTADFVHVGAVADRAAGVLRLYLNGAEIAPSPMSIAGNPNVSMPGISLGIGAIVNGPANFYDGVLDDVRVYNRVVTGPEMEALATRFTGPPTPATALQATVVDARRVDLTWTAGTQVANYRVERSPQGRNTWTVLTPSGLPPTATGYSDVTVTPGTDVDYRVVSVNPLGSATSPIASVSVPLPPPRTSKGDREPCGCGVAEGRLPGLVGVGVLLLALGVSMGARARR